MAEFDPKSPKGTNALGTLGGFFERQYYRYVAYPKARPMALDTCHDKFLYGRVDARQNTVTPSSKNLVPIPSSVTPNILALNVVVEAFEQFVLHMQKASFAGVINKTGNPDLFELQARRAFEPATTKYAYYTQGIFDSFVHNLQGKEKFAIKDFSSFLKFYRRHLLNIASVTPVTLTNFLLTSNASLFSTGLSIAIANEDASRDEAKYDNFISDPNFEFFRQCAKKYGFVLNKNAPWILTADLFTSAFGAVAMGNYVMPGTGDAIDSTNFFTLFYEHVHRQDFANLVRVLVNSYNELLRKAPHYDAEVGALNDRCSVAAKPRAALGATSTEIIVGQANQVLPAKYMIDLYIDLRQIEVGNPLSPRRLRTLKQEAYEIYASYTGASIAAHSRVSTYVNAIYRQYIYDWGAAAMQIHTAVENRNR